MAAASAPGAEASFEKEFLREDEMPDGEEDLERCDENGEEEAREASSRESRRGLDGVVLRFAYPARGIVDLLLYSYISRWEGQQSC